MKKNNKIKCIICDAKYQSGFKTVEWEKITNYLNPEQDKEAFSKYKGFPRICPDCVKKYNL